MRRNHHILYLFTLLATLLNLIGCQSAQMKSAESSNRPAETNSMPKPSVSPAGKNKAPSKATHSKPVTVAGTYEHYDYENGSGNINRLIVERAGSASGISIFANSIFPNGDGTTVLSTSVEGYPENDRGQTLSIDVFDDQDKKCRANIAFTGETAEVKITGGCSFKTSLTGSYKKISPRTETKIEQTDIIERYPEVPFAELAQYVNTYNQFYKSIRLVTGEHFVIRDVPVTKINGIFTNDHSSDLNKWRKLNDKDDTDGGVATELYTSPELFNRLKAIDMKNTSTLRITAVIITVHSNFDFYPTSYVTKIEGIDSAGNVIWTENTSEPSRIHVSEN